VAQGLIGLGSGSGQAVIGGPPAQPTRTKNRPRTA